jgi:hypothetical protein
MEQQTSGSFTSGNGMVPKAADQGGEVRLKANRHNDLREIVRRLDAHQREKCWRGGIAVDRAADSAHRDGDSDLTDEIGVVFDAIGSAPRRKVVISLGKTV